MIADILKNSSFIHICDVHMVSFKYDEINKYLFMIHDGNTYVHFTYSWNPRIYDGKEYYRNNDGFMSIVDGNEHIIDTCFNKFIINVHTKKYSLNNVPTVYENLENAKNFIDNLDRVITIKFSCYDNIKLTFGSSAANTWFKSACVDALSYTPILGLSLDLVIPNDIIKIISLCGVVYKLKRVCKKFNELFCDVKLQHQDNVWKHVHSSNFNFKGDNYYFGKSYKCKKSKWRDDDDVSKPYYPDQPNKSFDIKKLSGVSASYIIRNHDDIFL